MQELLAQLEPPWADHAIASVYAVLMSPRKRKELGVYFTPPHLVDHLLERLRSSGVDLSAVRIRDPAAGGAAFLVPVARLMVREWADRGMSETGIIRQLRGRLVGREIDRGLARLANALVRRMLVRECGFHRAGVSGLELVKVGDSLVAKDDPIDHEVGNPPYLRLNQSKQLKWVGQFRDIASGRLNLYSMFVWRALCNLAPGGLLGYVLPASFLSGPEFSTFRRRILEVADVVAIDVVEKRTDVFLDVIQDACFLVLRRRHVTGVPDHGSPSRTSSGVVRAHGEFIPRGYVDLSASGGPWVLPGDKPEQPAVRLVDYGYKGMVGYLVANRQGERLFRRNADGRVPLLWAKCITPDGRFDFERGRSATKANGRGFVSVPVAAPYVVRRACVLVQRTSSRSQIRRLVAAALPRSFVRRHGGVVAENHVIVLVPNRAGAVSPTVLARVINGPAANAAFARICGTASISVRVLEQLSLPPPSDIDGMSRDA
ncbi:MAG TPA: N-6 DNA methylase [Polyangia bacterium]|nr:N-6 DNA methylase [Polyangia bacterium]